MMEAIGTISSVGELADNIDDLEAALCPLTDVSLPEVVGTLPLFDRAKLYVFVTYVIESLLFC